MVSIPPELAASHLRTSCLKGDVLFWRGFEGKKQQRDSYFILLTHCVNDSFIVARAARRVEHYSGAQAIRIKHEVVFLKKGEVSFFPDDTAIDLTWRDTFTLDKLAKLLGGAVTKRGSLPPAIMQRIDDAVRNSCTLSTREINLILSCNQTTQPTGVIPEAGGSA